MVSGWCSGVRRVVVIVVVFVIFVLMCEREEKAPLAIHECVVDNAHTHTLIIWEDMSHDASPQLQWCNCVGFATSQFRLDNEARPFTFYYV